MFDVNVDVNVDVNIDVNADVNVDVNVGKSSPSLCQSAGRSSRRKPILTRLAPHGVSLTEKKGPTVRRGGTHVNVDANVDANVDVNVVVNIDVNADVNADVNVNANVDVYDNVGGIPPPWAEA
jgi:hypothetical protein